MGLVMNRAEALAHALRQVDALEAQRPAECEALARIRGHVPTVRRGGRYKKGQYEVLRRGGLL